MKRTGISIVEQHVEKLFLMVFLLAFLVVIAMQFTGGGNTVALGSNDMTLERAYEHVSSLATQKLAQMDDPLADPNVPQSVDDKSTAVLAMLTHPVNTTDSGWGIPLGPTTQGINTRIVAVDRLAVQPIEFPPPTLTRVAQYAGTLDPLVVSAYEGLRSVVPAQQPYDARIVSVGFEIERDGLYAALEQAGIPENWWKGRLDVLDVQLERRVVDAAGTAGVPSLVPPMPGRFSIREALQDDVASGGAQRIINNAPGQAPRVVHPSMYRISSGIPWLPPTVDPENKTRQRIQQMIQQYMGVEQKLLEINTRLQQAFLERLGRYHAQKGRGGGGRGNSSRDRVSPEQAEKQRQEASKTRLTLQLEKLEEQQEVLTKALNELGVQIEDEGINIAPPTYDPGPARLSETDTVVAWTNDLTVSSGETYEYRVRVMLTNPLFGYGANLEEETAVLAQAAHVATQWSPWSEPITIENDVYWFATRANEGGQQAIGFVEPVCTIEMYRFYYGYWRLAQARLHAGDTIAAQLDVASLELPIFQIDAAQPARHILDMPLSIETGAVVLDIRANPNISTDRRRRGQVSVVIRDALGNIAAHLVDASSAQDELRGLLDASVLSAAVATVREPQGDGTDEFEPVVEQTQEEDSDSNSTNRRGGPASRDGR